MTTTDTPYLSWARAHACRLPLCLRGSGMPTRALPSPLPPLPHPTGFDDLWHERQLAQAIAARQGVEPEQVFVALGTSGANAAVLAELLPSPGGEPGELVCEQPAYDPLWRTGAALGSPVHRFERRAEDGWRVDPIALEAELSHQTRAVILARPHNPTGVDIPEPVLRTIGEMAEAHDIHVIVDEVYLDFVPGARPAQRIHPRLVSTGSLTKVYGLSELRAGWVLAQPELVAALNARRMHAEALLPTLPQALTLALWDRLDGWRDEARATAARGAAIIADAVRDLDRVQLAPHAGTPFGFLHIDGDASALCAALEARGVGATPGGLFGAPNGLRVGWTRPEIELTEAAGILRETVLLQA